MDRVVSETVHHRQAIHPRQQAIHPAPLQFSSEQLALDPILHFFHYAHLPAALQTSSRPFCDLARFIINNLPRNAERSVALRKLLEAKDAAVRANVGTAGLASGNSTFLGSLKSERRELATRLSALTAFRTGQTVLAVPEAQREMLEHQSKAMVEYLAILDARIENIEHEGRKPYADGQDPSTRMDHDFPTDEPREVGSADPVRDGPIAFDA